MATPEQRAVWGVRQRFRHAAVRRPVLLSCGPPLSWARLLAGGVGVCELPARRRRDEVPKAIEARVIQAPRRNSPQAVPRGVRTHACAAHSRRSGWPGRPVPSARAPRIRCRDKFLLLICISPPPCFLLPLVPVTNNAFSIPTALPPPCFPLANLCVQICADAALDLVT
ncbi:hypothetical protein PVAP13_5KG088887 [Panicum virgatum]|uniref:Uncharacterized protein n=1 Tax=Panicum virgatum TaxID=38727 RepID=A0A8T0SF39_PANVG|nr:hypothetical protein PVAP13_5KG088887 [Panicum virgatum]